MSPERLGIVMYGVTGRMGTNQHLVRSILAIREQGGVRLADGRRVIPDPLLVGRDPRKLEDLCERHGLERWTPDLEAALASPEDEIFFDAATTRGRAERLEAAIRAGKHVYCEKPVAAATAEALAVARLASEAGVAGGVVQDKLYLPGLRKLRKLVRSGFFGRILAIQGSFGYWIFDGRIDPPQRPSWNYRRADGGGILLDMLPHWRYLLDHLFAPVRTVFCLTANHIPERLDEAGKPYRADAEDAVFALFELEGGILARIDSSWCVRVRRDDLAVFEVHGTEGSAVAGLTRCWIQPAVATPRPVWDPDSPRRHDFQADWQEVPDTVPHDNAFKVEWEMFIRHVCEGAPFPHDLLEGARGVQLAELGYRSAAEKRMIEVPPLELAPDA